MGEYDLTSFYLYSGGRKNTLSCHPEILSFRYRCVVKITIAMLRFLRKRSRFLNVSSVSYYFIISSVSSVFFSRNFWPFYRLEVRIYEYFPITEVFSDLKPLVLQIFLTHVSMCRSRRDRCGVKL